MRIVDPLSSREHAFGVAMLIVGCVLCAALSGCGSTLSRHVQAATVTRSALDITSTGIEEACAPAVVRATEDPPERAGRCLRVLDAHEAARAAWIAWVEALVIASEDPELLDAALALAGPILAFYAELGDVLRDLGLSVPALPALLGGAR